MNSDGMRMVARCRDKEPAEGEPTARSLPFAWDLGTSRWQLSDQTNKPLRNGDPGIA